jgi:phosphotransferase system enzyme I (PtsI)
MIAAVVRECGVGALVPVGAMIEVPAAALTADHLAVEADFLSVGTNDLIQYTLAIDRTDESVAHLYDPLHPAVLRLVAQTIAACARIDMPVAVCGEMAGDPAMTRLLIGMGLRQFSMHPAQLLEVKQQVVMSDADQLTLKIARILRLEDSGRIREQVERLNA